MELRYGLKKGVISLAAVGLLMLCTSILMFVHNPRQSIINMVLSFSEGTLFFNLWSAPPYDVILKVYMFNITNVKEFLSGKEKMNVTEIGPYVYKEILTNENATVNDTDGTVQYYPHREFKFEPDKSIGDPTLDYIMTTNLPLVGLQAFVAEKGYFPSVVFSTLARSLGSKPILNLTVHDYLWGYSDKLLSYAHTFLPHWIDFEKFGIFQRLMSRDNANVATIVNNPSKYVSNMQHLLTEEETLADYHIVKWNNLPGLKDWGYEHLSPEEVTKCHLVEGAFDGTIYPKNLRVNQTLKIFRKAFCRPVPMVFVQDTVGKEGFRQFEYKLSDNMFDVSEENKCFCYKNECMKGFQNIAPCYYDIPISLSQPHFLNAEPKMLETVHGLKPIVDKHGSFCNIQPDAGVPLSGSMRIQVNLDVRRTIGNHQTVSFNGLQVPLFWIEITTLELPTLVTVLLHLLCNFMPVAVEIVKYLLCLGGLALISGSAFYTLLKTKVRIPAGMCLKNAAEYTSIPIISLPNEILDKCEKSLRPCRTD